MGDWDGDFGLSGTAVKASAFGLVRGSILRSSGLFPLTLVDGGGGGGGHGFPTGNGPPALLGGGWAAFTDAAGLLGTGEDPFGLVAGGELAESPSCDLRFSPTDATIDRAFAKNP